MGALNPQELSDRLERGAVDLVDVRTPEEYEAGHIAGARHMPLETLTARAGEIDRERPVVFYCRSGNRSAMAEEAFSGAGYDAAALDGGLVAWDEAGLPLEPESGQVLKH